LIIRKVLAAGRDVTALRQARTPAATSAPRLSFKHFNLTSLKISRTGAALIFSAHGKTGFVRH
jgi:hypothetical protein